MEQKIICASNSWLFWNEIFFFYVLIRLFIPLSMLRPWQQAWSRGRLRRLLFSFLRNISWEGKISEWWDSPSCLLKEGPSPSDWNIILLQGMTLYMNSTRRIWTHLCKYIYFSHKWNLDCLNLLNVRHRVKMSFEATFVYTALLQ